MGVRHGFSAVPKWRSKGVLGVALAAALLAETFVAAGAAVAAPPKPRETPVQEEPQRSPEGELQAPDIPTAKTIARLQGERVEVIGERTDSSSTWALPDGTMSTNQASGPVWVRQGGDGTDAADWAEVDLTLELAEDGTIRPKAHPADLVLAGAGVPGDGALVSADNGDGESVEVEWTGKLPKPRLEGPRAVYPNVQPGVDLVVEVTRTGFEQFYVLTKRPARGKAPKLDLGVRTKGLAATEDADGGVSFTDASGEVVGTTATPLAWDAAVDGERMHPIAQPWVDKGEAEGPDMAPPPDLATPESTIDQEPSVAFPGGIEAMPAMPTTPANPPLPAEAAAPSEEIPEDAGRVASEDAATAKASPGLPLEESVAIVGEGDIDLALATDEEFLQHAETKFPVVIDPAYDFAWGFDTWVQHGFGTDQSGSPELRMGTFDGGYSVARSFVNVDLSGIRGRLILGATMYLYEWHSWSCAARNWQVWSTDVAQPWHRINAQPNWWGHWSTSSQTTGYSSGCNDNWVAADVKSLIQTWSNQHAGYVGIGLKAENERDNYGWKKFNSANAGWGVPTLNVHWNTPPGPATGVSVSSAVHDGGVNYVATRNPTLQAIVNDVDGSAHMLFQVHKSGGPLLWEQNAYNVPNGHWGSVWVPDGVIKEDGQYAIIVHSHDGIQWNTAASAWYGFTVDTTAPKAPIVTSTDYESDGKWSLGAGKPGAFTLTAPETDGSLSGYMWGLDKAPDAKHVASGTTTLTVTPPTDGIHVLQVQAIDKAGNRSGGVVKYAFNVGRAGLTSPGDGSKVVRRVRLSVESNEAVFTHVKFAWRRGPDSGNGQDIDLAALKRANGKPLPGTWTRLTDLGDYATWDAGLTLGHEAGPLEVQAVLASDAQGTGEYRTGWVSLIVDPDAEHAATDSIGPGSVNLLTGDYRLSSTDVDEFGLSLGRTTSSRDTDAGLEKQAELLTPAQQTFSALEGYTPAGVTMTRATDRGHSGKDSVRVAPVGNPISYIHPGPSPSGNIGMKAGRTYRASAWIYVPSTTGLNPGMSEGLRLEAGAPRPDGSLNTILSSRPTVTDAWQQLTVEFTAPANAGTPFIRLFNGFSAPDKVVYFDDISVREVWAPLGPQWSLGTADEATGTAYTHISLPETDVAELHLSGGGSLWFTSGGDGNWWPQPGAEGMKLSSTGDGSWTLSEVDGTVSTFARQGGADSKLMTTSPPVASGATRLLYEVVNDRVRLQRLIAPVEPGVDGAPSNKEACTAAVPAVGCEVMQLVYATVPASSSPTGTDDRLVEVKLLSASGPAGPVDAVTAVKYAYDSEGRLREVWDPRIEKPLKTTYEYDAGGRVVSMRAPGELPWSFEYGIGGSSATVGGSDVVDRSSGRLLRVSRPSLVPGTTDQEGPKTTSTVVYAVPLTKAEGGPHDLDADTIATWAQRYGPTDATAIFGPEDVPSVTTANATTPGTDGYRAATIHYLDASGREVNTATPAGPDAPAGGYIDTAEYDQYGNVVRSLDATNRLLALGQLPTADADLDDLGLLQADTVARAVALRSESTYGPQGLDLLRTRGPLVLLAVGNNPEDVRRVHDVSTYVYDEGKPDGAAYHLVTTQTDALLVAGSSPEQLVDVEVTKNGYDPIDGADKLGPSSGWKIGSPTKVTFDATGANLSALVRYDTGGRAVESRGIGATGSDARTNVAVYYTAGANAVRAECGNKPAYAGLPCMSYAAGDVSGHDPSRMAGTLPVKHVTAYNRYGSIASVTESATGPVNGTAATVSRTTVTEYDAADRVLSVTLTASGAGAGAPVAKTVNRYDETTGDVTVIEGHDSAGTVVSTVRKSFDLLGRMTRYEDGNGGWTTSVFDKFGKPTTVTDSTGATTSFTYDRAKEPRGFVTSVQDSVGGTVSASYGPDGQVTEQTLPGGVALRIGYDANRTPIDRTYVRTSDDAVIAASAALENSAGQMVTHTTPAASKRYTYDALGRLTDVRDTLNGTSLCVARKYGYDPRGNRESLKTAASGTDVCADPGDAASSATAYTYDTADRLVTESTVAAGAWVYDPLGRITTAPVRGSPGATVKNAYYANDLIASQTIDGVARQSWTLDAIGRFATYTNQAWAVGGDGEAGWQEAVTKVNHYDSDSDSPAWIAEDASLPDEITRYVDGLDGNLALETGKTGGRVLQLIDLHGDVMTTLPIRDGESTTDLSGLRVQTADEFGNPTDLTTGAAIVTSGQAPGKDGRYGWLGGKQRSADALAGVMLMGVRLYDPATGRFWSRDPSPGGNSTAYDYCSGDPVNCTDLDGHWGFFKKLVKKYAKKVAKIAEVVATVVPGPIGAAAAAISAGAYAASGNKAKALEMGVTAVAAMVPGGGAMVKAGFAAARAGGRVAAKIGKAVRGSCPNSFAPGTYVLMADGKTQPISDVQVGDLVAARDPVTGELTAQPVLTVIIGVGDKHLIGVNTARAPPSDAGVLPSSSDDYWTATANHPVWVVGKGWTDAGRLDIGDLTVGPTGSIRTVTRISDFGWVANQTVYNLSVANVHTYIVGGVDAGVLVHNCGVNANSLRFTGKTHVYAIVQEGKRDLDYVYKYGKGSRLTKAGGSVRASRQVNKLNRNRGADEGMYSYVILSHHNGTRAALTRERALIGQWRAATGGRFLPRGNKRAW